MLPFVEFLPCRRQKALAKERGVGVYVDLKLRKQGLPGILLRHRGIEVGAFDTEDEAIEFVMANCPEVRK